uniref:(northern house mosquito) hypothetical protein n=1 Tax=Culex pipiens TaxID=7175 RepID=A0A8D8GUB1_CULPI
MKNALRKENLQSCTRTGKKKKINPCPRGSSRVDLQDPWRNPQEFAIAVLPGSGAANEEDGTPSSVATTQGSSQETSPSPRPAFCPPQLVTPDKLKPNGDPDRFPRDAAGEDDDTPNSSTRSAIFLPPFLTPDESEPDGHPNKFPRDAASEDGVTPNCSTRSAFFLQQFSTPDESEPDGHPNKFPRDAASEEVVTPNSSTGSASCQPHLVIPDESEPDGDPDRFPRDAAGEDDVTPNSSTRSAIFLPQFLTPDKRSDHLGKNQGYMDWQIQEANSFNMEIFPMDVESDEIREGSVVFAGPSVPDIAASEINLPTRVTTNENVKTNLTQICHPRNTTSDQINTLCSTSKYTVWSSDPGFMEWQPPTMTNENSYTDSSQIWYLRNEDNETINNSISVPSPMDCTIQIANSFNVEIVPNDVGLLREVEFDELQESATLGNASRSIWSTSVSPVKDAFSLEEPPEIDLPEFPETPLDDSTASEESAKFGSNDDPGPPATLSFWRHNKLITLSRSSLRVIELPGVSQSDTSSDRTDQTSIPKSEIALDPEELGQTQIKQWKKLEGRRIVDYDYLIKWLVLSQARHSKTCEGILCPFQENFKSMISTLWLKCNGCEEVLRGYSEDPSRKYSLRYSVAWAIPNSGATYTIMHEIFSFLNMPFLDRNTVAKDELKMHQVIDEALEESLDTAIEEEKSIVREEMKQNGIAIAEDAPIESCAEIDGSWGQRSNGHRYSSASGCAVIVGVRSKKVCFVGCRNKRCAVCSRNQKLGKNKKATKHRCFRNFFGASGAMEPAIGIEGFEKTHRKGLKFTTVITDGDCTTVAKIKNSCKYGHEIKHQLCCNHNLKSLGKKLREIKVPKIYRDLVPKAIERITGGMRGAMAHCAASKDADKVEQLRKDIVNAPYHSFGIHRDCRDYFCTKETKAEDLDFFEKLKETSIWEKIMAAVESVADKAEFLSENRTSNLAENVFCQLCKFNVGKRVNTMSRGSYEMRVKITVLHKNDKYSWHTKYMEMFVGMGPGYWLRKMFREKEGTRRRTNASRSRPGYRRKKAKSSTQPEADCDYGLVAVERMEERTTNNEMDKPKIRALYTLSKDSQTSLKTSIDLNMMEKYAKGRILSKFVPDIVGAQSKTLAKKAEAMLQNMHNYKLLKANKRVVGRILRLVEQDLNLKLRGTRFFVDKCHTYLCCAPDAISDDDKTILIIRKLPETKFDPISPNKNSEVEAQTSLHACSASKCIIYYINGTRNTPIGYHIVNRDNEFFSDQIKSKLESFFEEHIIQHVFSQNMEIKK